MVFALTIVIFLSILKGVLEVETLNIAIERSEIARYLSSAGKPDAFTIISSLYFYSFIISFSLVNIFHKRERDFRFFGFGYISIPLISLFLISHILHALYFFFGRVPYGWGIKFISNSFLISLLLISVFWFFWSLWKDGKILKAFFSFLVPFFVYIASYCYFLFFEGKPDKIFSNFFRISTILFLISWLKDEGLERIFPIFSLVFIFFIISIFEYFNLRDFLLYDFFVLDFFIAIFLIILFFLSDFPDEYILSFPLISVYMIFVSNFFTFSFYDKIQLEIIRNIRLLATFSFSIILIIAIFKVFFRRKIIISIPFVFSVFLASILLAKAFGFIFSKEKYRVIYYTISFAFLGVLSHILKIDSKIFILSTLKFATNLMLNVFHFFYSIGKRKE